LQVELDNMCYIKPDKSELVSIRLTSISASTSASARARNIYNRVILTILISIVKTTEIKKGAHKPP